MKKFLIVVPLLLLVLVLLLVSGCSKKTETTAKTEADTGAMTETPATDDTGGEMQVAVHDCDGGCGMKDVPVEKLTKIDGKYYCAGCAKGMQAKAKTEHPK